MTKHYNKRIAHSITAACLHGSSASTIRGLLPSWAVFFFCSFCLQLFFRNRHSLPCGLSFSQSLRKNKWNVKHIKIAISKLNLNMTLLVINDRLKLY